MASLKCLAFVFSFTCLWIFVLSLEEYEDMELDFVFLERVQGLFFSSSLSFLINFTAESGNNVTLPCRADSNTNITGVEWVRSDLEPESVLFYNDRRSDTNNQHPSFKNRVELKDSQMKDGDVSLILKDVTISDSGWYQCYLLINTSRRLKSRNNLFVHPAPVNITAEPGDSVTLTCEAPKNTPILYVNLVRHDLDPENIYYFTNFRQMWSGYEHDVENQHPSFKNRVELDKSETMDGKVSFILKNVRINDAETYRCDVHTMGPDLSYIIHVDVHPSFQFKITAGPGDTVSLPCRALRNTNITTVQLIRPDLEPQSVFLYENRWSDPGNQHVSFRNRLELNDDEMKDGNVSLILKNVTTGDRGMYECRVLHSDRNSRMRIFQLDVNSADPELSVLTIVLHLVVVCPYIISTVLLVSLYQHRPSGTDLPVSMTTPPSNEGEEGLYEEFEDPMANVTAEHHL